jgi:hypothetical protein
MACATENITLANSFITNADNEYYVKNYTTTGTSATPKTSCLPTSGSPPVSSFAATDFSANGNIKEEKLSQHLVTWLTQNNAIAPNPLTPTNNSSVNTFFEKSEILRNSINAEYCYYENRYAYLLNSYFTNAASESTLAASRKQLKGITNLNSILNQILQVYQALINSRKSTVTAYYSNAGINVNSLNTQVDDSRKKLRDQSTIINNSNLETDAQSAMIEYSIEKNQSSRNLLAIYGFMNMVAAGLIFYLYRTTK